jgi:hypothetical protein
VHAAVMDVDVVAALLGGINRLLYFSSIWEVQEIVSDSPIFELVKSSLRSHPEGSTAIFVNGLDAVAGESVARAVNAELPVLKRSPSLLYVSCCLRCWLHAPPGKRWVFSSKRSRWCSSGPSSSPFLSA